MGFSALQLAHDNQKFKIQKRNGEHTNTIINIHASKIFCTVFDVAPINQLSVVNLSPSSDGQSSKASADRFNAALLPAEGPSFVTLSMALAWASVIEPFPAVTLSHTEKTLSAGASEKVQLN